MIQRPARQPDPEFWSNQRHGPARRTSTRVSIAKRDVAVVPRVSPDVRVEGASRPSTVRSLAGARRDAVAAFVIGRAAVFSPRSPASHAAPTMIRGLSVRRLNRRRSGHDIRHLQPARERRNPVVLACHPLPSQLSQSQSGRRHEAPRRANLRMCCRRRRCSHPPGATTSCSGNVSARMKSSCDSDVAPSLGHCAIADQIRPLVFRPLPALAQRNP